MIVAMIVPASLLLLETNHANLTPEAAETMAAATTATQVGRLFHHMSTRDRPVSFWISSIRFFSDSSNVCRNITLSNSPHVFPDCLGRLDWKLETASDSKFAAMTVVGFLITKATSAIAGSASLSTCIATGASWISFILYYSSRRS
jgi:hypothetical protein